MFEVLIQRTDKLLDQFRAVSFVRVKRPGSSHGSKLVMDLETLAKSLKFAFQPMQVGIQFVRLRVS